MLYWACCENQIAECVERISLSDVMCRARVSLGVDGEVEEKELHKKERGCHGQPTTTPYVLNVSE